MLTNSLYFGCHQGDSPYDIENLSSLSLEHASENLDAAHVFTSKEVANINVRITEIEDGEFEIVRKVEVIKGNTVVATFYASIISDSSINEQLDGDTFSGHFIIKNDSNEELYNQAVVNNEYTQTTFINFMTLEEEDKCSFTYIHDCVSTTIENMNPFEYALCLATAPECYAGLWVICSWDCEDYHTGE